MVTNYYASKPACSHCGRSDGKLHIGKSSAGWVFALNTHPGMGLTILDEWIAYWLQDDVTIEDEYGNLVPMVEMLGRILDRKGMPGRRMGMPDRPLQRSPVGQGSCIAHGVGTYDLHEGDFS